MSLHGAPAGRAPRRSSRPGRPATAAPPHSSPATAHQNRHVRGVALYVAGGRTGLLTLRVCRLACTSMLLSRESSLRICSDSLRTRASGRKAKPCSPRQETQHPTRQPHANRAACECDLPPAGSRAGAGRAPRRWPCTRTARPC